MSKNNKEIVKGRIEKKEKNKVLIPSIVLLVIMVFSMFGFALSGSGGSSSSGDGSDIAFGQNFQNPQTGELYYGTVKNGEQFVYNTIDGYDAALVEAGIARKLKELSYVNLYVDSDFNSSNARYLIEKSLRANDIVYNQVFDGECSENTLVLTINPLYNGSECIKFIASNKDAEERAKILSYHLVK
ncbi:MAG: hypothetical protein PF569_06230 [Candidatus Woesearchaeota archaeon]|jgi:hypothetical protein|nr:hypothetical protein [Candidatus Woesearchaeota archaeon]